MPKQLEVKSRNETSASLLATGAQKIRCTDTFSSLSYFYVKIDQAVEISTMNLCCCIYVGTHSLGKWEVQVL